MIIEAALSHQNTITNSYLERKDKNTPKERSAFQQPGIRSGKSLVQNLTSVPG
jgi:hypothetical protein